NLTVTRCFHSTFVTQKVLQRARPQIIFSQHRQEVWRIIQDRLSDCKQIRLQGPILAVVLD
ncbi:MAG: hypothetical protein JXA82_07990, partial [Sedimentisphaerales bacterium]|nr:hypothetical protein [Sedimentisphaerales bacterium]